MSLETRRLTYTLLLSLLIHTLLLSLIFSGQGRWFPGFGFPWRERRIEVPELRVAVLPAQVTAAEPAVTPVAEPSQQASVEQPVAGGSALTPSLSRPSPPERTAAAIVRETNPGTDAATGAVSAQMPLSTDRPTDMALAPIPAPAAIAVRRTDETTLVVPATPAMPAPEQEGEPPAKQMEATRQDAARQEAVRVENARQAADLQAAAQQMVTRQEAARIEAARIEAARVEAARVEAARVEAARVEAARVEAARVEAARVEAARVEAARVEAARVEAARVEAARVEAARVEAARVEAARAEAVRQLATQAEVAQQAAARREATLRAIGRQLDEEAARREARTAAARQSSPLGPSSSSVRRYRLFGRTDPNAELILYAEAWAQKIQLNMTFDMVREAVKQPHTDPLVTVAIRSDGSVESVTFVRSSGLAALDEAVRRVVHSQTPYQVFPPGLAAEFDVIEIRRTWYFDTAIRLY